MLLKHCFRLNRFVVSQYAQMVGVRKPVSVCGGVTRPNLSPPIPKRETHIDVHHQYKTQSPPYLMCYVHLLHVLL